MLLHWEVGGVLGLTYKPLKSQCRKISLNVLDVLNCKIQERVCTSFKRYVIKTPKDLNDVAVYLRHF